ncbi:MAG: hypothetical protein SVM79_05140, partial [Chloroflexota bacterium]|nr:hypothetical protein [Chloroflexota bacterium]
PSLASGKDQSTRQLTRVPHDQFLKRQSKKPKTDLSSSSIPEGEVQTKVPLMLRPPKGEVYCNYEAPKGELGFYLVSDGSIAPYRFHVRAPTLINLTVLRDMVVGDKIADLIITFGSIDICLGEVDR